MASGSEADDVQLNVGRVDGAISESGEDAARRGGAFEGDELLVDLNRRVTEEKGLPASSATVSQGLMKAIRSKPFWQDKLGDETIVNKYKREAIQQGLPMEIVEETIKHLQLEARHSLSANESTSASTSRQNLPGIPTKTRKVVTEAEMQDLIDSVAASQTKVPSKLIEPLEETGRGVWLMDNIVPKMLRDIIEANLDALADLPEKDFHPNSNNQVQDLIHPSLFPYTVGVSPLIFDKSALPPRSTRFRCWNRPYDDSKYQWLPSQFYVDESGSVEIRSYINNLERNPNEELYKAIELIFAIFLPMFEKLLSPRQNLRNRELQVIVKAANYIIQPKGTGYEGTWHAEGMHYEQIIASGIYYYSTSPWLEDHGLEFRRARNEGKDFPQFLEYDLADYSYDSEDEENPPNPENVEMLRKLTQDFRASIPLGAVPSLQDRLLVFSNYWLQHKVSKVVNNSDKVGVRKILVFFLVDPDSEIVSTKHVPEQQWERKLPQLRSVMREISVKLLGKSLPEEIEHEILTRSSQGMTMAEAKKHRLVLMAERAAKVRDSNIAWERKYYFDSYYI
ncbi:unnamed protein product [Calypogeia fissa]